MSLSDKDIKEYLGGLKRYQDRGVDIVIDGKTSGEEDWMKIFTVAQDTAFYACDYIEDQSSGEIKAIHFDKRYYPKS